MQNEMNKSNYYFYSALVCAVWFTLTSFLWTYLANVFISFPFGLIGWFLWYKGKQIEVPNKRYKTIAIILIVGLLVSLFTLLYFLFYE